MQSSIPPTISHKLANLGFVCAVFVVFMHVDSAGRVTTPDANWLIRILGGGICTFAVPFFFAMSGYLFAGHLQEQGWWLAGLKKRVRSLAIPYFVWIALYFIAAVAAIAIKPQPGLLGEWLVTQDFLSALGFNLFEQPFLGVLWYVRTLFLLVLFSPALLWPLSRGKGCAMGWLSICFLLYGVLMVGHAIGFVDGNWFMFFWQGASVVGLFFFVLGGFLRRWPLGVKIPAWGAWLMLVGCAVWFGLKRIPAGWDEVGDWVAMLGAFTALWYLIPGRAWPKWLTGLSFPIYLMHLFFIYRLGRIKTSFPGLTSFLFSGPIGYLVLGLSIGAACIVAGLALRRWMPRVAGVLFGGR